MKNLPIISVYILGALILAFGILGAARQLAPDLHSGFLQNLSRQSMPEKAGTVPPIPGSGGLVLSATLPGNASVVVMSTSGDWPLFSATSW